MSEQMVTIPARSGKAARVQQGQKITVVNTHGSQVVDTWAFSAEDTAEWMSMEHSRAYYMKLRPEVGDTLVTNGRRPILSLVEDTSGGDTSGGRTTRSSRPATTRGTPCWGSPSTTTTARIT
jgi:uncharacterized protein YcgI (DUF1989 family)